jgi:hypothetical protein
MFPGFKSRGFGLDDAQIRCPGRLARLVLVIAPALCCAASTGLRDQTNRPLPAETRPARKQPKRIARSLASCFTRGLRRIASFIQSAAPLPALWAASA